MTDPTSAQVYRVNIKATPQQVWDAITQPERSKQYFHGAAIDVTAHSYSTHGPDGSDWGSGSVFEFAPPHRLVHAWSSGYSPELAAEPPSRVTWEIEDRGNGVTMVTVTHDRLEHSPKTAESVFGKGWSYVVSSLKTYLETGTGLPRVG